LVGYELIKGEVRDLKFDKQERERERERECNS
jgi:hypothetical protein